LGVYISAFVHGNHGRIISSTGHVQRKRRWKISSELREDLGDHKVLMFTSSLPLSETTGASAFLSTLIQESA
jgi:hypothetical protein